MDKVQLLKLIRRKVYWEKERDRCFWHIFFFYSFLIGISIKAKNYSGIKKVNKIGWTNSSRGEKFNCVFDWILVVILIIYLLVGIYYMIRIQVCSSKLVHINQHLLEALNDLPDPEIMVK